MYESKAKRRRIELGQAIKARREELGFSQYTLASLSNSGQSNIHRIEAGKVGAGIDKLVQIADALEISLNELIPF